MITSKRPQDSRPTRIALLSVGVRDRAVLELLFERLLSREFEIADPERADMALVDGDSDGGRVAASDWRRQRPAAPLAVLTLRPQVAARGLAYVAKPIDVQTLIATLRTLRASSSDVAQPTSQESAAPVASQTHAAPLQFPRPVVINSRAGFRSLPESADDTFGKMVSVEICMSNDLSVCLAADHEAPREPFRSTRASSPARAFAAA